MSWQEPKTDWGAGDIPGPGDFNRIEENIVWLKSHRFALFTTSGIFTVPDGVDVVYVTGCGGGGGGAGANHHPPYNAGGGGGGGEAVIKKQIPVTPGETVPIYIGAGGARGDVDQNGGAGGATSFGSYLTLSGGAGGNADSGLGGAAGGPGGQDGYYSSGGGSIFGMGGQGERRYGMGFGGGGAGGNAEEDEGLFYPGGYGAPGFLLIEW